MGFWGSMRILILGSKKADIDIPADILYMYINHLFHNARNYLLCLAYARRADA